MPGISNFLCLELSNVGRMKDFYDIRTIASTMEIDGQILFDAIKATFERRKTDIITEALYVFSDEFKQDKDKQT